MRRKIRSQSLPWLVWLLVGAPALAASDDYRAPTGFNGHAWGEPLSAFQELKLLNANTVSNSPGVTRFLECRDLGMPCDDPARPDQLMVIAKSQVTEGNGSFAVSEYYREPEQNPWAESLVALNAITYMFCAQWHMPTVPANIRDQLRYCGTRMVYRSDTAATLFTRPNSYQSNHDRLLRHLIRLHGPPDGYRYKKGQVSVGPLGGTDEDIEAAESETPLARTAQENPITLLPRCAATITMMFDAKRGWGVVFYATAGIYNFAYGRHTMRDENNELYVALSGRNLDQPFRKQVGQCERKLGSLVCARGLHRLRDSDIRKFEPVATTARNQPQ
jgi:hypothetical protein